MLILLSNIISLAIALVSYLPTPPLGQDMAQGQFLSGVGIEIFSHNKKQNLVI